ncbi:SigE family RNA polymerase sigma factor [Actinoplanes rectilineatus]|uniref:SigE family RNA polymerase sigma factor n=1 Tax=Actinoplanes rectilineatus TaxID=113571 RepID=UPI0009FAFB5B|nr:SigE family RNA polymerase sigma factor [Actinoplanes rectilineatus]
MKDHRGSERSERETEYHELVTRRRPGMLRTAVLLAAGDSHLAEDLVQTTLTRLYLNWTAFRRAGNADAYIRRSLVNALIDERRRVWRRREQPVADIPDRAPAETAADPAGQAIRQALRELPPRMRAAVVFRYFHDLDVAETAHALGCSEGTVKSQTSRGLDRLRTALESTVTPIPEGAKS